MSVDLGCSPAHGNGPSRLVCPSACIIGAPVQSSTLRDPRSEPGIRGEMYHPNLHGPGLGGRGLRLALELDTWQDSPHRRNKALPSMIPHRSTKLGTLAQGEGWSNKHAHPHSTGSETKLMPLWLQILEQCPLGVWGDA